MFRVLVLGSYQETKGRKNRVLRAALLQNEAGSNDLFLGHELSHENCSQTILNMLSLCCLCSVLFLKGAKGMPTKGIEENLLKSHPSRSGCFHLACCVPRIFSPLFSLICFRNRYNQRFWAPLKNQSGVPAFVFGGPRFCRTGGFSKKQ